MPINPSHALIITMLASLQLQCDYNYDVRSGIPVGLAATSELGTAALPSRGNANFPVCEGHNDPIPPQPENTVVGFPSPADEFEDSLEEIGCKESCRSPEAIDFAPGVSGG